MRSAHPLRRSAVDAFMKETREALDTLLKRTEPAIERSSPVRLSEFGQEISRRIGAEEWSEQTAPMLVPEARGREAFQVDEFCDVYVRHRLGDDWNTRVAKIAFQMGTTRESVLAVLRVVLRDKLVQLLDLSLEA